MTDLYSGGDDGDICVYRRCPQCGKYLKAGEVLTNMAGDAKVQGDGFVKNMEK